MRFPLPALLAVLLLLLPGTTLAQQEWARTYGGSGRDALTQIIAAGDGLLAAGSTDSADGDLSGRTREGKARVQWITPDGGAYAAGTSLRHGRKTTVLQRVR